jgi:hypothetical protein
MVSVPLLEFDARKRRSEIATGVLVAIPILVAGFFWTEVFEVVSVIVLLAIAAVCARIYAVRRRPEATWFGGTERIWLLISLGFVFLALDEALSIHEAIDVLIHRVLAMRETWFTDRIDDIIILVYGVLGILILFAHRAEFRGLAGYRRYFVVGFLLLAVMVALDLLSNRRDFLHATGLAHSWVPSVHHVLEVAEEVAKLLAEGAFLLGFLTIYNQVAAARVVAPARRASPSAP